MTPSVNPEFPFCVTSTRKGNQATDGWRKVCGITGSGIWVLKVGARTRMLPANLDHLRVGWRTRGSCETAWVTPGHNCLSIQVQVG